MKSPPALPSLSSNPLPRKSERENPVLGPKTAGWIPVGSVPQTTTHIYISQYEASKVHSAVKVVTPYLRAMPFERHTMPCHATPCRTIRDTVKCPRHASPPATWACNMNANTNAAAKCHDEKQRFRKRRDNRHQREITGMVSCDVQSSDIQHLDADAHDGRVLLAHAH
jgi:hypothetical protein